MLRSITFAATALVLGLALIPAKTPTAAEALEGPRCTLKYPRGYKVKAHGTKKRPITICKNGDLQSTWGGCTSRYQI